MARNVPSAACCVPSQPVIGQAAATARARSRFRPAWFSAGGAIREAANSRKARACTARIARMAPFVAGDSTRLPNHRGIPSSMIAAITGSSMPPTRTTIPIRSQSGRVERASAAAATKAPITTIQPRISICSSTSTPPKK